MTTEYIEDASLPKGCRQVVVPEVSSREQIQILQRMEKKTSDPTVQRDIQATIAMIKKDRHAR